MSVSCFIMISLDKTSPIIGKRIVHLICIILKFIVKPSFFMHFFARKRRTFGHHHNYSSPFPKELKVEAKFTVVWFRSQRRKTSFFYFLNRKKSFRMFLRLFLRSRIVIYLQKVKFTIKAHQNNINLLKLMFYMPLDGVFIFVRKKHIIEDGLRSSDFKALLER